MNRHPPRSPLFPYTPLFRSGALARRIATAARDTGSLGVLPFALCLYAHVAFWSGEWDSGMFAAAEARSEEHTSELQSQSNLVCRLLLEKKKEHLLEESCRVA